MMRARGTLREAVYVLPRRFMCRVFGIHGAVCFGRRDETHMAWRRQVRGRSSLPWWDRVHPIEELLTFLYDLDLPGKPLALAERLDIAWSRFVLRRKSEGYREGVSFAFQDDEMCQVCQARWRIGRPIHHLICALGKERSYERSLAERQCAAGEAGSKP